ncbi:hypothetical protein PG987_005166 [Apiospora arundinis]
MVHSAHHLLSPSTSYVPLMPATTPRRSLIITDTHRDAWHPLHDVAPIGSHISILTRCDTPARAVDLSSAGRNHEIVPDSGYEHAPCRAPRGTRDSIYNTLDIHAQLEPQGSLGDICLRVRRGAKADRPWSTVDNKEGSCVGSRVEVAASRRVDEKTALSRWRRQ